LTEKSKVLKDAFGADVIESYVKLKIDEWLNYSSHRTEWERQYTLDC